MRAFQRTAWCSPLMALAVLGCGTGADLPLNDALPESDGEAVLDLPAHGEPQDPEADVSTGDLGPQELPPEEPDQVALQEVNQVRAACGLPPLVLVDSLNRAAQSHAEFLTTHCEDYARTGLSPHQQDPSWSGFIGVQPWDRMIAMGYPSRGVGMAEVIAFENDPKRAVAGWIRTLYHRLPLLDPRTRDAGYGRSGPAPCSWLLLQNADVMDLGMGLDAEDLVVLYPPDGARMIPTSFDGLESPTPIPPPAGWPSGTIITVQFGRDLPFQVRAHELLERGEVLVPHIIVAATGDPASGVTADGNLRDHRVLALYGLTRLKAGTEYTVRLDLIRDGQPLLLQWGFKTRYQHDG